MKKCIDNMSTRWLIFLAVQLFLAACAAQKPEQEVILASVSYSLSEDEVTRYEKEAMQGAADAALKLTNFYWVRGLPRVDEAKHWAIIGAENGSAEAQFRAFQCLRASTDILEQLRALYWLKRSAEQDYPTAVAILKSCPEVSEATSSGSMPCFGPDSGQ